MFTSQENNGVIPTSLLSDGQNNNEVDDNNVRRQLQIQSKMYASGERYALCDDTALAVKRFSKKIYRCVKFLSEKLGAYEQPNFVEPQWEDENGVVHTSQAVQLCDFILEKMSKLFIFYMISF